MTKKELEILEKLIIEKLSNELPEYLYYHSLEHTLRVMEKAEVIARYENVNERELTLIKIAALFHDIGFIKSSDNHEATGCVIAREYLNCYNLKPGEIDIICGMIMATKIPQSPRNHLEEIFADADLEYLGTEDFRKISDDLYKELKHRNPELTVEKWNEIQINFFETHSFFTEFGNKNLSDLKMKHLMELKEERNRNS
jgi:uncharacterized protein